MDLTDIDRAFTGPHRVKWPRPGHRETWHPGTAFNAAMSKADSTTQPLLDEENATFIQAFVSINVASRGAGNTLSIARAYGSRVSADRREVTVFLSVPASTALLNDLRQQRVIAVVFSAPASHKTIQLKATDARIEPLQDGDLDLIASYKKTLASAVRSIGYNNPFVDALARSALPDYLAVTFTPGAAFVQTPGPKAGQKLDRSGK